jgi:hypothetical protein
MSHSSMRSCLSSFHPYVPSQTVSNRILMGIPTRFGNSPVQWRSFWDATGGLWATGALAGKYAGVFISTGGQGGGQEATAISAISTFVHHGMLFVPLGYRDAFGQLANLSEIRGGTSFASILVMRACIHFVVRRFAMGCGHVRGCRWLPPAFRPRARVGDHPGPHVLRACLASASIGALGCLLNECRYTTGLACT